LCVFSSSQCFFFFGGGTGVWTRDLALARQTHNCLSHSPSHFCIFYFWDRFLLYDCASVDHIPPICVSLHSWDDRHAP
jgi:hypothetical protein